jgi:hypothetical protein
MKVVEFVAIERKYVLDESPSSLTLFLGDQNVLDQNIVQVLLCNSNFNVTKL